MSTLTYTQNLSAAQTAEGAAGNQRRGFWRRLFDGIIASRQRSAEREIVRYLNAHGGLLNDDMEREIMQRLSGRSRPSV